MNLSLRPKIQTTIKYVLITDISPLISTFVPPDAFRNSVIEFLRIAPYDIVEFANSLTFLELYLKNLWSFGCDFGIVKTSDFKIISELLNNSNQLQLFFLDGSKKEHIEIYRYLTSTETRIRFFHFYKGKDIDLADDKIVTSPYHFMEKLVECSKDIIDKIGIKDLTINPSIALELKDINEFSYFNPTRTNYFLLNRIIGNQSYESSHLNEEAYQEEMLKETEKANLNKHTFDRQNFFIKQIQIIDSFFVLLLKEDVIKLPTGIEPKLPPLILIAPFHNPDLKEIYKVKELVDLMQVEQSENYISETETRAGMNLVLGGADIMKQRVKYLDEVSFLHSSITYSPVVRLPIKGKSIYRELSFFRIKTFPNFSRAKNRRKLKKTIFRFGKIFKENVIGEQLEKTIKNRDGQIIAISDLPIEWLLIDGTPISFTHDVCRLPETSLHGLMSFFTSNQTFQYTIPKDIIKKTLVIHGAHEEGFRPWHEITLESSKKQGFLLKHCAKIDEVVKAIGETNPEFLIFDCHGGYDETTQSTFLWIGEEKLDGNFIVENGIVAPVVFLSACGTAPTYGTFNPIANAFFEAGAISVTSTYLPILVNSGSLLYLRILNNLEYAANHCIHKNWLGFISHLIRTSSINEAYLFALHKRTDINHSEFTDSNTNSLVDSMVFYKRRHLHNEMDNRISNLTGEDKLYYSEIIPEYLLYSNLGRSDLILFEVWEEEFHSKNNS